jgi:hypothetical protein
MSTLEQEIMTEIRQLDDNHQQLVLDFVRHLKTAKPLTAREIMRLPQAERDQVVASAFALAADEDFETFEAYSEEPFEDDDDPAR